MIPVGGTYVGGMSRSRVLGALLAGLLACVLVAVVAGLGRAPGAPAVRHDGRGTDHTAPLAVLAAWDEARVDAWRRGDRAALAALYTRGSGAGRVDARLLAAYDARGLRVRGLRVQRAAVDVLRVAPERLVLRVTDRVVGGWVRTAAGGRVALPRDGWSTRRLVLVRSEGRWRVARVRDRGGRGPTPRPR